MKFATSTSVPRYDKEDVLAALSGCWADFYGQYTPLKPQGGEMRGPCPIHGGKGPNLAVDAETGYWFCHSDCGAGGDVFDFLRRKEGLDFPDALVQVAEWAGAIPEGTARRVPPRVLPTHPDPDPHASYLETSLADALHQKLMATDSMRVWLSEHRGLTAETLTRFRLGMEKGDQGLYRITFPVFDRQGRLVNVRRHLFAYRDGLDRKFKTLPWEKGLPSLLFPLSVLEGADEALIVEGEADALLACQMGFTAVSGTLGAGNWKPQWTEELRGLRRVTLLYDADGPGQEGAQKVAAALSPVIADVRLARVGRGKDLTEWAVEHGATPGDVQGAIDAAVPFRPTSGAADASWEPPVPFTDHALPPFPVEALPPALAGMVSEAAESIQVAPEMPAMLALAVVAAASARRCLVRVGQTHSEPLNLFVAVTGEPGERKSAVADALAQPLRDAEREMTAQAAPAQAAAQEERAVQDQRLLHLRGQAAKAKDPDEAAALVRSLGEEAAALTQVPPLPRLLADDVTPEKLAGLMADQGGTMAILSAEGGIFGILAGRYSDGKANLDLFLKGHAGEDVRVDRKGGGSVHVPRARLTLGLAVQPDVLSSLSDTPAFRGRGLLGRFLYSLPQSRVGSRLYQNRPIGTAARCQYAAAILSILALPQANPEDPGACHCLRLDGEALDVWADYANAVERRLAPGGDLAGIRDWASKLAGAVARIAGGFHLVEHAPGGRPWDAPIAAETVLAAWAVGEHLIPHALAAFGHMGADPALALARRLLAWVEREDRPEFSLRDCHQANRSVGSPRALEPALTLLCERGYLREKPAPRRGGPGQPRSPMYEVNPLPQNTQNTRN